MLCVINIYSKYAWVVPLKVKKGITITNAFEKNLDESNHKRNKKNMGRKKAVNFAINQWNHGGYKIMI